MSTPWPNATLAKFKSKPIETEAEAPATPSELVRVFLAHAQLILGVAVLQFQQVLFRLAMGFNLYFDFDQSDEAFETLQWLTWGFFAVSMVFFGLSMWLIAQSQSVLVSQAGQRHLKELWLRDSTSRWIVGGLAISVVAFVSAYFSAGWLRSLDLVSKQIEAGLQTGSHVILGVLCIVAASLRIKQAIKIGQELDLKR